MVDSSSTTNCKMDQCASKPVRIVRRKVLTMDERLRVIQLSKNTSARKIAMQFGVGKTQVQSILLNREKILEECASSPLNGSRTAKRRRAPVHKDIDTLCLRWFYENKTRGVPITKSHIQVQALKFASELDVKDFKASNGWLESFYKRHDLGCFTNQEKNIQEVKVASDFKDKLRDLCKEYDCKDIFSMDETELLFRDSGVQKVHQPKGGCSSGKRSKDRITLVLCSSVTGERLPPLVIGKWPLPEKFEELHRSVLPVTYRHNNKGLINNSLMLDWLANLNLNMQRQERSILLFLDGVPSEHFRSLSHVRLSYLPPHPTVVMQPLNQGVIQAVKLNFRKLQLSHIADRVSEKGAKTASDILKEINILQAINWFCSAWHQLEPCTIEKCFARVGFPCENLSTTEKQVEDITQSLNELSKELFGCEFQDLGNNEHKFPTDASILDYSEPPATVSRSTNCQTSNDDVGSESSYGDEALTKPIITTAQAMAHFDDLVKFSLVHGDAEFCAMICNAQHALDLLIVNKHIKRSDSSEFS